jgi:hypothetical protein
MEDPKQYKVDAEVLSMVWVALFESGCEDLAQVVSAIMIDQGCRELKGTEDHLLILNFWRTYMEEREILKIIDEPQEVH